MRIFFYTITEQWQHKTILMYSKQMHLEFKTDSTTNIEEDTEQQIVYMMVYFPTQLLLPYKENKCIS